MSGLWLLLFNAQMRPELVPAVALAGFLCGLIVAPVLRLTQVAASPWALGMLVFVAGEMYRVAAGVADQALDHQGLTLLHPTYSFFWFVTSLFLVLGMFGAKWARRHGRGPVQ